MTDIRKTLIRASSGEDIAAEELTECFRNIMQGQCEPTQIASLLTALRMKGETKDEIAAAASVMRECATKIPVTDSNVLDTCGTGGDGLHTFNISTATAIVAAACGVPVAKHGNRSVSSSSGSADVLEALGVRIDLSPDQVADCIKDVGIGFCFAPLIHGAMKYAVPVRKALGFRTIFNLLGPLTNPAGAEVQLLGANNVQTAEKLAEALAILGSKKSLVVSGADGLDELSLWGDTTVFIVTPHGVQQETWNANRFGLESCNVSELQVSSAQESAEVIRSVLTNGDSAVRRIVTMNAAAALLAFGQVETPIDGVQVVSDTLDSGAANATLEKLIQWTNDV
ncbi:MAG: anthranilate phosphoribosyltransferase [Planctomycetaceae bacterium]